MTMLRTLIIGLVLSLASLSSAWAFQQPMIVATSIEGIKRSEQGIMMDIRILFRNENSFDLTVENGSALFGLEGFRVGAMKVKESVVLPARGMEEVVLTLAGDAQQRRFIAKTMVFNDEVDYAYKGFLRLKEFDKPFEIKQVATFKVPQRFHRLRAAQ